MELVNIRVVGVGAIPELDPPRLADGGESVDEQARISQRDVVFDIDGKPSSISTPVFDRQFLKAGNVIRGPAIVEQADTTTLVLRGEQHLYEVLSDGELKHKVRKAGEYARGEAGEAHRECGGPEGALVYFSFQKEGGSLFDLLDPSGATVAHSTLEELAAASGQAA